MKKFSAQVQFTQFNLAVCHTRRHNFNSILPMLRSFNFKASFVMKPLPDSDVNDSIRILAFATHLLNAIYHLPENEPNHVKYSKKIALSLLRPCESSTELFPPIRSVEIYMEYDMFSEAPCSIESHEKYIKDFQEDGGCGRTTDEGHFSR